MYMFFPVGLHPTVLNNKIEQNQCMRVYLCLANKLLLQCMLKFLDNKSSNQGQARQLIQYKPEVVYGNSYEVPSYFENRYSIFNKLSYVNPYIPFQQQRKEKVPSTELQSIQPRWVSRESLNNIQAEKILNYQLSSSAKNRSKQIAQTTPGASKTRNEPTFRIFQGQFTSYLDKNKHYKQFSPLFGGKRCLKKHTSENCNQNQPPTMPWKNSTHAQSAYFQPKQSVTKRSSNDSLELLNLYKTIQKKRQIIQHSLSSFRSPSLNALQAKQSLGKQRLKHSRRQVNERFALDIQNRKKKRAKQFELPKLNQMSNLQLTANFKLSKPKLVQIEHSSDLQEIDLFEELLSKKIK